MGEAPERLRKGGLHAGAPSPVCPEPADGERNQGPKRSAHDMSTCQLSQRPTGRELKMRMPSAHNLFCLMQDGQNLLRGACSPSNQESDYPLPSHQEKPARRHSFLSACFTAAWSSSFCVGDADALGLSSFVSPSSVDWTSESSLVVSSAWEG